MISAILIALVAQEPGGAWELRGRVEGYHAEEFGSAIQVGPDFDLDGWPEYLVGAPDRDGGGREVGGASLIHGGTGQAVWEFVSPYTIVIARCAGSVVAFVPDFNGDGFPEVLLGDPCDSGLFYVSDSGRVYVLDGLRGTLLREHLGSEVGTRGTGDQTGATLLGLPDVDGDGAGDYVIGSPQSDLGTGANDINGKITMYSGRTGVPLWSLHGRRFEKLGSELAAGPDLTNDGRPEILVNAIEPNSVYFVDPVSGNVVQSVPGILTSLGTTVGPASCLASTDLDGDGLEDLLFASYGGLPGAPGAGQVSAVSSATRQLIWRSESTIPRENYGQSLAHCDDLDFDGVPEILVGVPTESSHATGEGYVQVLSGRDGARLWRVRTTQESGLTYYGRAVAGYGRGGRRDLALIGEPRASNLLPEAGAVHVVGFEPFLSASTLTASAAAGASITYTLDFPASEAGLPYALLASASGHGPTTLGGLSVPLTADNVFARSIAGRYPSGLHGARGRLDAQSRAQATLFAGAGALAAQVGRTFHFAAVTGIGGAARMTSIAVPLTIEP